VSAWCETAYYFGAIQPYIIGQDSTLGPEVQTTCSFHFSDLLVKYPV
jgi:hypothetical protein